ncbi:MAG: 1-acyl-sn-glycerol-3-phosphate acyltransferase [Solirubrobacterales bacterium]|nr:1-acyl-sn-glycerol-3-phosphate acyltransferase [Solirubrobacterales bacterium]
MIALQRSVAVALAAYARSTFRTRKFGLEHLRLEPATILSPNHRSDSDVPVLVSALYPRWSQAVQRGLPWPTFAADDHAFMAGFLAGYPEGIPLRLRRLLWPISVGGVLEQRLQCVPVREPARMRLVELLRWDPERPLDGGLPPSLDAALRRRAGRLKRPEPQRAADVLDGAYADLLWSIVERDGTPGEEVWREHLRAAVGDFRKLVATLRSGGVVVIFPEGELSREGQIGPLRPGLASLARRGRARFVQPVAITYDPLPPGRPRAYVSVAPALEPSPRRLVGDLTEALRAATPLTVGQVVARFLLDPGRGGRLEHAAEEWVARAQAQRRPIEPALLAVGAREELHATLTESRRLGSAHRIVKALSRELETCMLGS